MRKEITKKVYAHTQERLKSQGRGLPWQPGTMRSAFGNMLD
jgi:hypothetical protein